MKRCAIALFIALAVAAAQAQVKDRAVAVEQTEVVVTVTKVDPKARTVIFSGPKGGVATLAVPLVADVGVGPNWDQAH